MVVRRFLLKHKSRISLDISNLWSSIHHILTYGPLVEKGWKDLGGIDCFNSIPLRTHILESAAWMFLALFFYVITNVKQGFRSQYRAITIDISCCKRSSLVRLIELFVGLILVAVLVAIAYFKVQTKAGIIFLQPCHIICACEAYAMLFPNNPYSVFIAMYFLPPVAASMMALIFPEADDLQFPFEIEIFWIEHWLIILLPIYLLIRQKWDWCKICEYETLPYDSDWVMLVFIVTFSCT